MIEKLDTKMDCVEITVLGKHTECLGFDSAKEIGKKLNELVDAVNELHEEAENNARIRAKHENLIDTLVEENNIHERQIDELQMKAEPEKYEMCDEPMPQELLDLLCRTRKALEIAVDALKKIKEECYDTTDVLLYTNKALEQITTLEQKDIK